MDGENLISWNLPNFVSITLMVVMIWLVLGGVSHLIRRKIAAAPAGVQAVPTTGNLVPV